MKINDIKESMEMAPEQFQEEGFLQELNRMFLHPAGLSMALRKDDNGNKKFVVFDARKHTEVGLIYGLKDDYDEKELQSMIHKHYTVSSVFNKFAEPRKKYLKKAYMPLENIPGLQDINEKIAEFQKQQARENG